MEWIISLVAVLVSMVTVIVSYFSNRDSIRSAEYIMKQSSLMGVNRELWKDFFALSSEIMLKTEPEMFTKMINDIAILKMKNEKNDEQVNAIGEIKASIKQLGFNITTYYHLFIPDVDNDFDRSTKEYITAALLILDDIQNFYFSEEIDDAYYGRIHERIEEFDSPKQAYLDELQRSIIKVQQEISR